jgi:sterol desaturase/sphingolipid hydroxylase (fatty acid hydroxylase superfamily)
MVRGHQMQLSELAATFARASNYVLWAIPLGIGLELLFPRTGHKPAGRVKGAAIWSAYTVIASVFIALEGPALRWLGLRPLLLFGPHTPWPVALCAAVLAAVLSDFFYYWCHRLQHTPLLWRFHAIHHSIRDMSAVNCYHHWTEQPIHFLLIGIPLLSLVRVDGIMTPMLAAGLVLQTTYIHTPSRLHFGPVSRIFVDNRFHRHHHIIDKSRSSRNFGVFTTLWDQLFGTAYFPAKDEWCEVGLAEQGEIETVRDFLLLPFYRRPRNDIAVTMRHHDGPGGNALCRDRS